MAGGKHPLLSIEAQQAPRNLGKATFREIGVLWPEEALIHVKQANIVDVHSCMYV